MIYTEEILKRAYDTAEPLIAPVRLDLSITEECNTNCPYCWQIDHTAVGILTYEIMAKVIEDLCSWRPPWSLNITGGEPTIWKGFEDLIALANRKGIRSILINTNAIKLANINYARKLIEAGVTTFGISIDTLNPKKHLELRRFPFSKMQKALDNLYELKKIHKFGISLNSVLSKLVTPEEVAAVKEYAYSRSWGFYCQAVYGGPAEKEYGINKEERDARDKALSWNKYDDRLKAVQNTDKFSRDTHPLQKTGARCDKGSTTIKMTMNGSVKFCWNGPDTIGNIHDSSILEIWRSHRAKEAREYIRNKRCSCLFDCDIYESLGLPRSTRKVMELHNTNY